MKPWKLPAVFAAGALAGCMAGGVPAPAQSPSSGASGGRDLASTIAMPLLLDRSDLRMGTTVQYRRVPGASELNDLTLLPGLAHIVLTFPEWPASYEGLQPLSLTPEGADVVVILPGYPPSPGAAELWNYVQAPLRIVIVVPGPPPNRSVIDDLNQMRRLERVVAQMERPDRYGFERLQRPLSFRKIVD